MTIEELTIKDLSLIIGIIVTVSSLITGLINKFWFLPTINKSLKQFESDLKKQEYLQQEKWKIKRDACLEALEITDAVFSNAFFKDEIKLPSGELIKVKSYPIDIPKARACYNKLATTCKNSKVLDEWKKTIGIKGKFNAGMIVDLRNAIREELELGEEIDLNDRDACWISVLEKQS